MKLTQELNFYLGELEKVKDSIDENEVWLNRLDNQWCAEQVARTELKKDKEKKQLLERIISTLEQQQK